MRPHTQQAFTTEAVLSCLSLSSSIQAYRELCFIYLACGTDFPVRKPEERASSPG